MRTFHFFAALFLGMSWIVLDAVQAANPTFVWVRSFGGSGSELAQSLALNTSGHVFSCGHFESTVDFDPSSGVDSRMSAGSWDGFVSHLVSNGNYVSAATIGGSSFDQTNGIALDVNGNLFYTGQFYGTVDFDPTAGVDSRSSTIPTYDAFLTRINADGTYAWTLTFDGAADSGVSPQRMAADPTGGVVIVGSFTGTDVDFDPGMGQDLHSSNSNGDVFATKYLSDGTYVWTKTFGGLFGDVGQGVAVDSSGKVTVCGVFSGTADFDPGPGTDNRTSVSSSSDFFVTLLNSDGSYGWTYNRGSASPDGANAVAIAPDDSILVTGSFHGSIDFDPGAGTDTHNAGSRNVFITKLLSDGTYGWTRSFGDNQDDIGHGITVDSVGNVLVVGQFGSGFDFDPGPLEDLRSSNGDIDVFVSLFNLDGAYGGAYTVGAGNQDRARAIAVDNVGNAVVMGTFRQTVDFDMSAGSSTKTSLGAEDIFLLKLQYATIETPGACCEGPVCDLSLQVNAQPQAACSKDLQ